MFIKIYADDLAQNCVKLSTNIKNAKHEKIELTGSTTKDYVLKAIRAAEEDGSAAKFTSEGFVRLKVTASGEALIFEIEDTGIGIRKGGHICKKPEIAGTGPGLSKMAARMEAVSKGGELGYCQGCLPGFLEKLRSLHKQLSAIIPNNEEAVVRPKGDNGLLLGNIQTALEAEEDFNGDMGIEVINKLLEYDFGVQINKLLENAKNAFLDFDFDTASE